MRGILLCGGQSRRMGQKKQWLPFGDRPLLLHTLDQLYKTCGDVVVVASDEEERERLARLHVNAILDQYPGQGPLAGLHAGLSGLQGEEWACLVACDLPFFRGEILQDLAMLAEEDRAAQAVVPCDGEQLFPVCALYRGQARQIAASCLEDGQRALRQFLQRLQVSYVPAERYASYRPFPFHNMNTIEEYEFARALWKKEGWS